MSITLAEAKVGMADKVDQMIVDEFRRSSLLLDRLVFDNAISPGTGGSTLTYGYIQLKTPTTAAVRAINSEYRSLISSTAFLSTRICLTISSSKR